MQSAQPQRLRDDITQSKHRLTLEELAFYEALAQKQDKLNELRSQLTSERLSIIADLLQQERDGGIHDVLAYLDDEIALRGLRLIRNGVEINEGVYEELHYDWVARREGSLWPDEEVDEQ